MEINRIVISTQPKAQAGKLSALLRDTGVLFYSMPLIRTRIVNPNRTIQNALSNVGTFDKIIFTSKCGVSSFFILMKSLGVPDDDLKYVKFAAIGPATAVEILKNGFEVHYINDGSTSEEFSGYLLNKVIGENEKILLPLGNLAPDLLRNKLSGRAECIRINVYETIKIKNPEPATMKMIDEELYDLVVFTSPSAFDNLIEITGYRPEKQLKILSIGQTTTKHIERRGFKVLITAKRSTIDGLAEEIVQAFALPSETLNL